MVNISLHPRQKIEAEIVVGEGHRWIVIRVGVTEIVLHESKQHQGASIRELAEALADPLYVLDCEAQAVEHDAAQADREAAAGQPAVRAYDESNGLRLNDDCPF